MWLAAAFAFLAISTTTSPGWLGFIFLKWRQGTRIGAFPTREFLVVIGLKGVGALPEIKGSLGGQ